MNSVSWFIYFAQVSHSLGIMCVALGVIALIVMGLYVLIATIVASIDADDFKPKFLQARYGVAAIGLLTLGNLAPERNTLYAIAAAQVGEQIIKTEIASDATKALHQWIKKQIEPETKK